MRRLLQYMSAYTKRRAFWGLFLRCWRPALSCSFPWWWRTWWMWASARGDASYILKMGGLLVLLALIGLDLLPDGPVFCRQGGLRGWGGSAAGSVRPYRGTVLPGDRHGGSGHADHPDDQRYQPGAEWGQYDAAPAAALSLCGVRRHGDGLSPWTLPRPWSLW